MKLPFARAGAIFAVAALGLTACGGAASTNAGSGGKGKPVIAMSTYSRSFEFYQQIENGAKAAAAGKADLLLKDPNGDLAAQTTNVEDFVSRKADLVALVPIDSSGAVAEGQLVTSAGIPLITVDIALNKNIGQKSHIASDNVGGGRLAADKMAALLGSKGDVAIIDNPAITSVVEREKGFTEEIAKVAPGIHVVATQSGDSKREKAQSVTDDLLQKYPQLSGIFSVNDEMGLGALQAVRAANKEKQMNIIGFDASQEGLKEIQAGGAYKATVAQDPTQIGKVVVETALKVIAGQAVPASIPIPVTLVDNTNVKTYIK